MSASIFEVLGSLTTTFYLAILTIVLYFFYNWCIGIYANNTPPGPRGLPFLGYLPFLTKKPYIKLQQLRGKYGPVYSIRMGSRYVVVLNDFQVIRDAFMQDAFMGRPDDLVFNFSKVTIATGALTGMKWKEQRRFSLHALRDLGFGKTPMEQLIREEICEFLEIIKKNSGKPIVPRKFLAPSVSNNISTLVFGRRMKYDDPKRIMLDGIIRDVGLLAEQVAFQSFFPWLRAIASFLHIGNHHRLNKALTRMKEFIRYEIAEHKNTFDPNNIRDFIDGYLVEIEKRKDDPQSSFLEPVLEDIVRLFFGAGSETVTVTTSWLLLLVATHQDVQKKVQEEIDRIIGRDVFPSRSDNKLMPYTEAVIMELMRWRSIVPINVLRYTLEDTVLNSYFIPKHSYVVANLWGVLHDPELWGPDVEEFRPERFLSKDGKEIQKPDYFIPFSIGKRACAGETLARVETFLYFTALLQKFRVKMPAGAKPDFEGRLGIGLQPKPQELVFELR